MNECAVHSFEFYTNPKPKTKPIPISWLTIPWHDLQRHDIRHVVTKWLLVMETSVVRRLDCNPLVKIAADLRHTLGIERAEAF